MSSSSPTIVTATSPAAAGCGQFPVSIAAGDVNADGSDDILVMDLLAAIGWALENPVAHSMVSPGVMSHPS
jgi:hypothetical protein